jgi:acyl-CoA synthetase (AMP-forming)/AMP-acid ligase II
MLAARGAVQVGGDANRRREVDVDIGAGGLPEQSRDAQRRARWPCRVQHHLAARGHAAVRRPGKLWQERELGGADGVPAHDDLLPRTDEPRLYPEVIDPETGAVLSDGQEGELVFTSLTKEALPVIRYRTRDLTRLLPPTARSMRRMAKITGRSDDMMIVRGVNVFPTQIEELILKDERLAPHFLIELRREDRLDTMTVKVEAQPDAVAARGPGMELSQLIKNLIGVSALVAVRDPGAIERSLGKANASSTSGRRTDGARHAHAMGSVCQPRKRARCARAPVPASRRAGKRCIVRSTAMRASSRATDIPAHACAPAAKARCGFGERAMSKRSASGNAVGSRFAAPMHSVR